MNSPHLKVVSVNEMKRQKEITKIYMLFNCLNIILKVIFKTGFSRGNICQKDAVLVFAKFNKY